MNDGSAETENRSGRSRAAQWFRRNLSRDNLRIVLRIAAGIILSVIIARLMGLKFAPSTCIVTLLGIQATKRDTLRTALQRVVSVFYTIALALLVYNILGADLSAFCAAAAALAFFTYLIGWNSTLSINIVVLVHLFLQQQPFTMELVSNEIVRVFIGLLVALAINWRMPTKEREFKSDMSAMEHTIEHILNTFAAVLRGKEKVTPELGQHLEELKRNLSGGMDNAYIFANNNLSSHAKYYMHYVAMRETEAFILDNIYLYIQRMEPADDLCLSMADYMDAIGHCVAMEHPMDDVEKKHTAVVQSMDQAALPADKRALQNRMCLFLLKESLEEMTKVKQQFIDTLTARERERYWTAEHH